MKELQKLMEKSRDNEIFRGFPALSGQCDQQTGEGGLVL